MELKENVTTVERTFQNSSLDDLIIKNAQLSKGYILPVG